MNIKAYKGDAGIDLINRKLISITQVGPDFRSCVWDTGVKGCVPDGMVGLVLPRSSASLRGITVTPGVIDSGFTGTIKVVAMVPCSLGRLEDLSIAQLVIVKYEELPNTQYKTDKDRDSNGFGSSNEI